MKVLAYFGLTMLSILIQFCVIDFIHPFEEQLDLSVNSRKTLNYDILKNISLKPHALYYQTHQNSPREKSVKSAKNYNNLSLPETILGTFTEITSTIVDFYDDNMSSTETGSTESYATTTDIENNTEITLFEKPNSTKPILPVKPKKTYGIDRKCSCNLLFQVCDVNCCCDEDCLEDEKLIFNCVKKNTYPAITELCFSPNPFKFDGKQDDFIDNLFCIAKTNLPEHRDIHDIKVDVNTTINKVYKWRDEQRPAPIYKFTKLFYKSGDPIWIYENGSLSHLDLPMKTVSNFCTERKPLRFLQEEKIKCNVKLGNLEMLEAYRISQESELVSSLDHTINATTLHCSLRLDRIRRHSISEADEQTLERIRRWVYPHDNCSTLHCTNWTVIICNSSSCVDFNNTLHEPSCSQKDCKNIARNVEYIFYYHENKFTNATIKFFVDVISSPFQNEDILHISQEISVKFILTNDSVDKIITLSGNPGYIQNLPVVVSYAKINYTEQFFNSTNHNKYLPFLKNRNGACVASETAKDYVLFGVNKRRRCTFTYLSENETNICESIQKGINKLLGIDHNITVSPLGNPFGIKDEHWKIFETGSMKQPTPIYGRSFANKSKLQCYNMITRISYIFIYADVSENSRRENKILAAILEKTPQNVTLSFEDTSVVLTADTNFIDNTKPPIREFAVSLDLNIHLPKDFFFPFSSSNCCKTTYNVFILALLNLCLH